MQTIDVLEAGAHLDQLIEAAAKGEPFLIAKNGTPLVTVTGLPRVAKSPRIFGALAGQMTIPEDFNRIHEDEIQAMFENDGKL